MSGHEALDGFAAVLAGMDVPAADDDLQHAEQFVGNFQIALVAGLVKREKDLVRKTAGLAGNGRHRFRWSFFIRNLV